MRAHTSQAADVITGGSHNLHVLADVFYGTTRRLQDVPLDDWSFTGDYDANVKTGGTVSIAYQGDFADSVSPRELTDALAPFGQELRAYAVVTAGVFIERIPLGVYRITDVPSADDEQMIFRDRLITVGSRVQLTLLDRFYAVDVPFRALEQPLSLTSAWAEIARISRLQVTRTVDDAPIPASIVYSRNRLSAVQQLAGVLGGRAYMRADGTVGVIPDDMATADLTLRIGEEHGTIIDVGNAMSSEGIHNVVYGDFEDDLGNPIHAEADITVGPLSISEPFGERPVEYPGDQKEFIKTQAAADKAVRNHLAKVSRSEPRELPVELTPDPRIEIGDVTDLERLDGTITGRVVKYTFAKGSAMNTTVRVPNA